MSNWIKVRADEVRRAEKEKSDEFDRKTTAASVLKAQIEPVWNRLQDHLRQAVKDFNVEFPEADRKIDSIEKPSLESFVVRRNAYPSVILKIQLNNAGSFLQYSISRTARKGANSTEKQASISYTVTNGQVAYADETLASDEDVAKLFLDSFFEF